MLIFFLNRYNKISTYDICSTTIMIALYYKPKIPMVDVLDLLFDNNKLTI